MKPMTPMQPMKPMQGMAACWPGDLGDPAASGAQNGVRYAFFPDRQRLLVERDGATQTYDSGGHRISGVAQQQGDGSALSFSSADGPVALDTLRRVD